MAIAAGGAHSLAVAALVFTADAPALDMVAGSAYSYQFAANESATTYTVTTGTLPTGLTLTSAGLLSGTPTAAGTFSFLVTVTNAGLWTTGLSHTVTVTAGALADLAVTPPASGGFLAIAGSPLTFAVTGSDSSGNAVSSAVTYATSAVASAFPDVIDGDTITFFQAGVRTVTVTAGSVSTTFDVSVPVSAATTVAVSSSAMSAVVGDVITLSLFGTDAYGNDTGDLASQAVFTSDWASDVIDGATVTFGHASVHTITATLGGLTSTVAVQLSDPVGDAKALAAASAGAASDLASTGFAGVPLGIAALLVLLTGGALVVRRRRVRA